MVDSALFGNKDALAKLAALNPLTQEAEASTSHGRTDGKRTIAGGSKDVVGAERIGGDFSKVADAPWLKDRNAVLNEVVERSKAMLEALEKPPIKVTLPDGKVIDGTAWVTSPMDIATGISKGLAQATCVCSVKYSKRQDGGALGKVVAADEIDGEAAVEESEWELWDAKRPLEGDCDLQLHKFDDPRGKQVFRHTSAHILGTAHESL